MSLVLQATAIGVHSFQGFRAQVASVVADDGMIAFAAILSIALAAVATAFALPIWLLLEDRWGWHFTA